MRTKTLALSAMLGAVGTASLVAQTNVYSINAVGYMNVICPPGFSMIACQVSNAVNNQIGTLMLNNTAANGSNSPGIYDNVTIYKWVNNGHNGGGYNQDYGASAYAGGTYANGWGFGGTNTMNPGEAIWFYNGNTVGVPGPGGALYITNTFVGTVPQGTNTVTLPIGFSQVSSPVPFSGDMVTNMSLTNVGSNDTIFVYENAYPATVGTGYNTYGLDPAGPGSDSGYMGEWFPPGDPQVNVGQGLWYWNETTAYVWTQIFSINP